MDLASNLEDGQSAFLLLPFANFVQLVTMDEAVYLVSDLHSS